MIPRYTFRRTVRPGQGGSGSPPPPSGLIQAPHVALPTHTSFNTSTGRLVIDQLYHPGPPANRFAAATHTPTDWTSFKAAYTAAMAQDHPVIECPVGVTISVTDTFNPPPRTGAGVVVIRSGTLAGVPTGLNYKTSADRATIAHIGNMCAFQNVTADLTSIFQHGPNAHDVWYEGLYVYSLVNVGRFFDLKSTLSGSTPQDYTTADLPKRIAVVHCVMNGVPPALCSRAVRCDWEDSLVMLNSVYGFREPLSGDSQAFLVQGEALRVDILGNYGEAGSENFIAGGSPSLLKDGVPPTATDVRVMYNHFNKPASWIGVATNIKNLYEIKEGVRIMAAYNVMEGCWKQAQDGTAWKLKQSTNTQVGQLCKDILLMGNWVRKAGSCYTTIGAEGGVTPTESFQNLEVCYNLFTEIGTGLYTGDRELGLLFGNGLSLPSIAPAGYWEHHNTLDAADQGAATCRSLNADAAGKQWGNVNIYDNVLPAWDLMLKAGGVTDGTPSLDAAFSSYAYTRNIHLRDTAAPAIPAGNWFEASAANVFENPASSDWRLKAGAVGKGLGLNGQDPGYNHELVMTETANVV